MLINRQNKDERTIKNDLARIVFEKNNAMILQFATELEHKPFFIKQ